MYQYAQIVFAVSALILPVFYGWHAKTWGRASLWGTLLFFIVAVVGVFIGVRHGAIRWSLTSTPLESLGQGVISAFVASITIGALLGMLGFAARSLLVRIRS